MSEDHDTLKQRLKKLLAENSDSLQIVSVQDVHCSKAMIDIYAVCYEAPVRSPDDDEAVTHHVLVWSVDRVRYV